MTQSLYTLGGVEVTEKQTSNKHRVVDVELIRERALNALLPETFECLNKLLDQLQAYEQVVYFLIRGRGRAFSAGGDVRSIREKGLKAGAANSKEREQAAENILSIEYNFMKRLRSLEGSNIITIAFADGYAFGAGMGLFEACSIRLVTEKSILSMPEARIGLIPDCGSTYYFAKMPGSTGMYAALTGTWIKAGDAIVLGLADAAVSSDWNIESIQVDAGSKDGLLREILSNRVELEKSDFGVADSKMRRDIDICFSSSSLKEVFQEVERVAQEDKWAQEAMKSMKNSSPRALDAIFRTMRCSYLEEWDVVTAIEKELEVEKVLCSRLDFEEGVRALLIDKDNEPKWEHYSLM